MKKIFKDFFTTNVSLKILSIFIGIAIWALLSNRYDPIDTKPLNIPITYTNEEKLMAQDGLVMLSGPETVQIIVSTRTSKRAKATPDLFTCTADLIDHYGGDFGSQRVHITVTQVGGTDTILDWAYNKNDPNITVSMDEYIAKDFQVELLPENDLTEGLFLENSTIFTPSVVTVSGPLSKFSYVAAVKGVVNLQELSESGGGNFTKEVKLELYDANGRVIQNTDGALKLSAETAILSATVTRIKTVNLVIEGVTGTPAEGYRYVSCTAEPSTVAVRGLKSVVADLSEIYIPANEIDIEGISENTVYTIDITQYLPEGVTLAETGTIDVRVEVEHLETENFVLTSGDVRLVGNVPDYEYSVRDSVLNVRVRGFKEDLEQLTSGSFTLYVDVTGLTEGVHRLKVAIPEITGYTIDNADSLYVTVQIAGIYVPTESESSEEDESTPSTPTESAPTETSEEEPEESTEPQG